MLSSPARSTRSSLPPSSLPHPSDTPTRRSQATPSRATPKRSTRSTNDALTLGDNEGDNDSQPDVAVRRRRKVRGQMDGDVPIVRDVVGERLREDFEQFLQTFTNEVAFAPTPGAEDLPEAVHGELEYLAQIDTMLEYGLTTVYVDFTHLLERDEVVATAIQNQYYRFLPYIRRAVYNVVTSREEARRRDAAGAGDKSFAATSADPVEAPDREYNVAFYHLPLVSGIRELRTNKIGTLMSISGTVTRTSEVRPELLYGSFVCEVCGGVVNDVEQQFKYTEPSLCPNPTCGNRIAWQLQLDSSKFTDWQKVRIQENPSEIPTGSMPRSLDVILRSELVERAKAGDKCVFTGTFIVVPDVGQLGIPGGKQAQLQRESTAGGGKATSGVGGTGVTGLKSLGVRDLQYKTAFLACMVTDSDSRSGTNIRGEEEYGEDQGDAFWRSLTDQEQAELATMVGSDHIYSRLVESIAPTVYGHEIVKKGLLLQLMGGVHKQTSEGMNLRGDINICIVGDPSTSKSQFLKYICSFLPRSVYTSGKASSAAGLTAAVVKDEETGDFTIEAGALMLADNGICAIDEFDKMDISDQVAIHEAMEQQTISIAKAGIHATLNARTSILAAANPIGGRYDRKRTLRANVQMSAPIMSRFDLFFVILDECDEKSDLNIARHIVNVHRFQDEAINPEFSTEALQRYIRYARTFNPKMSPEAGDVLVEKYRTLRQDDAGGASKNSYRITVRQLESMIRLSEAIARANCSHEITPAFVREAYTLLRQSIVHVEQDDIDFDEEEGGDNQDSQESGGDYEMSAAEVEAMDQMESSAGMDIPVRQIDESSTVVGSSMTQGAPSTDAPAPVEKKKRMVITHDKYISIRSMIILHLTEVERETGKGLDREELIDWYLEEQESEMHDVDDIEYEKELITKMLKKLVKENYLLEVKGDVQESLPSVDSQSAEPSTGPDDENVRVYYLVHPSVDTEG